MRKERKKNKKEGGFGPFFKKGRNKSKLKVFIDGERRRGTDQRTLTMGRVIKVWLASSLTRLDLTKKDNLMLFSCIKSC